MNDEYLRILKMIEEGKLTAEEGADLIKALGTEQPREEAAARLRSTIGGKKLRIVVTNLDTGKDVVNIRIPLRLARIAEKMIPSQAKQEMREQGIDLSNLLSDLDEIGDGPLVDIDSDDGKEHVKVLIYIE
jgi:DUF4097 and DUF4098 domain-containing protein YvlB